MSFWSLLLRVVLSLSVALNGVAIAAASPHMAMHQATMHQRLTQEDPQAAKLVKQSAKQAAGCHEAAVSTPAAHSDHQAALDGASEKQHHDRASSDCCKSGTCSCPCVHASQLPLGSMAIWLPAAHASQDVRALALGYPAPALGHLIRPPIA